MVDPRPWLVQFIIVCVIVGMSRRLWEGHEGEVREGERGGWEGERCRSAGGLARAGERDWQACKQERQWARAKDQQVGVERMRERGPARERTDMWGMEWWAWEVQEREGRAGKTSKTSRWERDGLVGTRETWWAWATKRQVRGQNLKTWSAAMSTLPISL